MGAISTLTNKEIESEILSSIRVHRRKTDKRIDFVVIFYVYAHTHKERKKNEFMGEKRDPSERYVNCNLRNVTHITQKPSYVYTFFTYTLKEITA